MSASTEGECHSFLSDDLLDAKWIGQGGVILMVLGAVVMFWALAVICEEYFVPALMILCEVLDLSDDVAGATLMAAGASSPELFTSFIGLFISKSSIGVGTIIGSEIFNHMIICAGSVMYAKNGVLELDKRIFMREVLAYFFSLLVLISATGGGLGNGLTTMFKTELWRDCIFVSWDDAVLLVLCYFVYALVASNFKRLCSFWDNVVCMNRGYSLGSASAMNSASTSNEGEFSSSTMNPEILINEGRFELELKEIPAEDSRSDDALNGGGGKDGNTSPSDEENTTAIIAESLASRAAIDENEFLSNAFKSDDNKTFQGFLYDLGQFTSCRGRWKRLRKVMIENGGLYVLADHTRALTGKNVRNYTMFADILGYSIGDASNIPRMVSIELAPSADFACFMRSRYTSVLAKEVMRFQAPTDRTFHAFVSVLDENLRVIREMREKGDGNRDIEANISSER